MNDKLTYDEFERDWLRRHRGSIPRKRKVSSFRGTFWIGFWIIVASGAAVYSAAHTIPAAEMTILRDVPQRSDLAKSAFTILELVIFGAAAKRRDVSWLVYLMICAVLVALVSNVGSSVLAVTQNGGTLLNQASGVLLSILAPITALAAGEVLHMEQDKRDKAKRDAEDEYTDAHKEVEAKINAAWTRYVKEHDGELPDRRTHLVLSDQTDSRQTRQSPSGFERTADGQKRVIDYLSEYPEDAAMPSRHLAAKIELVTGTRIGHDTANKGRNAWRQRQVEAQQPFVRSNGHHEEPPS